MMNKAKDHLIQDQQPSDPPEEQHPVHHTYIFDRNGDYTGRKIENNQSESNGIIENYIQDREPLFFNFADPVNYPKKLDGEELDVAQGIIHDDYESLDGVKVLSIGEIDHIISETGVYDRMDKSALSNSWYFISQSDGGKMDTHTKFETGKLNIIENPDGSYTAHDQHNAGNFIWGAASKAVGFSDKYVKFGSNTHAKLGTFRKDSKDDQYSIHLGREYYTHFLERNEGCFRETYLLAERQAKTKLVGSDVNQTFTEKEVVRNTVEICDYEIKEKSVLELQEARKVFIDAVADNHLNHSEMQHMNQELGEALRLIHETNNQKLVQILEKETCDIIDVQNRINLGDIKLSESKTLPVAPEQIQVASEQAQTLQAIFRR
jgi:hypothetical protein